MKTLYEVTEADRQTGRNLRKLRRRHGESMAETIAAAGLKMSLTTMSKTETGYRALTLPEATKLAAHFSTTVDRLMHQPEPAFAEQPEQFEPVRSEQAWLGNEPSHPPLFMVEPSPEPDPVDYSVPDNGILIDRDQPMHPDEYRLTVWLPYLEARYSSDKKAS